MVNLIKLIPPTPIIQGTRLPHPSESPPLHMTKTATESSDGVNLCRHLPNLSGTARLNIQKYAPYSKPVAASQPALQRRVAAS